ncbi:pinin-like [Solanum tuberosum]|uniref:pinin-like n=1 Tax=Solanum tuberosum TaxID=4113 RepID=UPI00073A399A|nr:PREDICTED: pinin-like [Solanum tuberosum]
MDLDTRPHHRTAAVTSNSTTSELFICFTSRLSSSSSSSSMKFSKSILSPGRARDGPLSLPTSLSRRLRANGSLKGGQASPMFPATGKKRGSGFENPEPTSPKVTCIGQVRVKTKKKVKQTRSLSKRRSGSGEVSFRKIEQATEAFSQTDDRLLLRNQRYSQGNSSVHYQQQECVSHRNQRWVHLPLTICEALRAFGAEFSCLFPCRSSCFSTNEREKEEKGGENNEHRSCGAVFARWLVAVQDGEGGKRRDIELVVASGEEERTEEEEEARRSIMRSSRRHVFEDIEFKDEIVEMENGGGNGEKDEEEDAVELEKFGEIKRMEIVDCQKCEPSNEVEATEKLCKLPGEARLSVDLNEMEENPEETEVMEIEEERKHETCELAAKMEEEHDQIECFVAEDEEYLEQSVQLVNHMEDNEEIGNNHVEEEGEKGTISLRLSLSESSNRRSIKIEDEELELVTEEAALEEEEERFKSTVMREIEEILMQGNIEMNSTTPQQESEQEEQVQNDEQIEEEKQIEQPKEPENEEKESVLPECLLLMMCEPKLSMEVSKETWVCRRDFLRWLPERKQHAKPPKKEIPEEQPKRRRSTDTKPTEHRNKHLLQPPRSSCSLPAATGMSMTTMIEQKLVNAAAYEPFVLTRCKSEPMRTAAAKLTPENCCWKNRKIEPHRPATFGVGAAGVGF